MTPVEGAPYGEGLIGQIIELEAEVERLKRAGDHISAALEAQMREKHKEAAEAKFWFGKAQEWRDENRRHGIEHAAHNTALLEIIDMLEHGYFPFIEGSLSEAMCCDGRMCGCRGASVGEYIAHHIRQAVELPAQGMETQRAKTAGLGPKDDSPVPQECATTPTNQDNNHD